MLSTAESKEKGVAETSPLLYILGADPASSAEVGSLLEGQGFQVEPFDNMDGTAAALRRVRPALLVRIGSPAVTSTEFAPLGAIARTLDIPMLDVFEAGLEDGHAAPSLGEDADDWVWRSSAPRELAARVNRLLRRRKGSSEARKRPASLPTDSRFFPLIVHDLRTPLNVIGLSLRMIDQAIPKGNAELEEDLRFVEENFKQIERMLSQLSDYCRLFELESAGPPSEFSPERLLADVVEDRSAKPGSHKAGSIRLEAQGSSPAEASLDMVRARQAFQYALDNAMAAANGVGVLIRLYGGPDRVVTELRIDQAPPPSVKSVELRPQVFERLCGTAAERRGMDLAIVARISEMFGGSARLEADDGKSTRIILDWPARLATS